MTRHAIALGLTLAALPGRAWAVPRPAYFPAHLATDRVFCTIRWSRGLSSVISDFERKLFGRPRVVLEEYANEWYSKHLAAADEPSLSSPVRPGSTGTTLRFTWLRSFHPPVMVRIEMPGPAAARVVAKQLSGKGGYEPGTISRRIDRPLTRAEARMLAALLRRTGVLALPPGGCARGLDGAEWLIEVAGAGGYRLVERWSPKDGGVREFGLAMLKLTGWSIDPVY